MRSKDDGQRTLSTNALSDWGATTWNPVRQQLVALHGAGCVRQSVNSTKQANSSGVGHEIPVVPQIASFGVGRRVGSGAATVPFQRCTGACVSKTTPSWPSKMSAGGTTTSGFSPKQPARTAL